MLTAKKKYFANAFSINLVTWIAGQAWPAMSADYRYDQLIAGLITRMTPIAGPAIGAGRLKRLDKLGLLLKFISQFVHLIFTSL
jgi:hypothetical protein